MNDYICEPVKGAHLTLLEPARLLKCLGDETRLTLTLLIRKEEELCVCEMTHALEESQPKVSRHLAQLRTCGLLNDRREGQWVYYRLSDSVPEWVDELLQAAEKGKPPIWSSCSVAFQEWETGPIGVWRCVDRPCGHRWSLHSHPSNRLSVLSPSRQLPVTHRQDT